MSSFAEKVIEFYQTLRSAPEVPDHVEVMYPHHDPKAWEVMNQFYQKFYGDSNERTFLIGINPGRFGAGTTGIPFTDPIKLEESCGIKNPFERRSELSSRFIYHMIAEYGGVTDFYNRFYITSVSPLGFTSKGKNLNYYDHKVLQETWEPFMVKCLKTQVAFGAGSNAFSLGQGKNHKYLQYLNKKYSIFESIEPLPHPRWIMQYRLKRISEFSAIYCSRLNEVSK